MFSLPQPASPRLWGLAMASRKLALVILLSIFATGFLFPSASGQNVFLTVPQPSNSVSNQIIDFYAGGTSSEGYQLQLSPSGGSLTINNNLAMSLVPWGYVMAKWSIGSVNIIFLVNVTETNFRIGFLYLTNSSTGFLLRWFDYGSGEVNDLNFQGVQHVYNRTVIANPVKLPELHIPLAAKTVNGLYALGPQLYLNSKEGYLLNGTSQLKVVPLLNQLYDGPTDYNELWSLLADDAGQYYFAILYMQNSDSSHVILEHQLRLNDYQRISGETLDAKWSKGPFDHNVIVRMPVSNVTVKIDGFPFQTNSNGVASTSVPDGIVTVQVPDEITNSTDAKVVFSGWKKYGASNPLQILVNSTLDITAKYVQKFPLVVFSPYGTTRGSGWYVAGTNATFSTDAEVDYGNGTRRLFQTWEGDSASTMNEGWVVVNSPKHVSAVWRTQFAVTLNAIGLPSDVSVIASVGGTNVTIEGSRTEWVDQNTQLPILVQTKQVIGSNTDYFFSELRVNNQTFVGNSVIAKPVVISLVYSSTPKLPSKLSLNILPSVAIEGYPLSITGSIDGLTGGSASVDIQYSSAVGSWHELARVPVTQRGVFAYTWQPSTSGNYSIKASWPGDPTHSPVSKVVDVRVVGTSIPAEGSDVLVQLLRSLAALRHVPSIPVLLSFAASMLTLGYIFASFLVPGGSPIIGYLIGSMLLGFIFVFPVSAAVILVAASKTRRRPSLVWLTPLFSVWIASLALVMISPSLLAPQPLVMASELLLILSNVFTIPLFVTFCLARLVV
jgi:hypothetical protein